MAEQDADAPAGVRAEQAYSAVDAANGNALPRVVDGRERGDATLLAQVDLSACRGGQRLQLHVRVAQQHHHLLLRRVEAERRARHSPEAHHSRVLRRAVVINPPRRVPDGQQRGTGRHEQADVVERRRRRRLCHDLVHQRALRVCRRRDRDAAGHVHFLTRLGPHRREASGANAALVGREHAGLSLGRARVLGGSLPQHLALLAHHHVAGLHQVALRLELARHEAHRRHAVAVRLPHAHDARLAALVTKVPNRAV
mmetsp:Transcript_26307/g.91512  ORF Transcript_26307/g.91512 Transcript_26307/m.91512 type:complete len:255 (-) Transcript_26307:642-1406(-)